MNQKQKTIGFFSLVGLAVLLGICLIVSSCHSDSTPQQQAQYAPQPQQGYAQPQQAPVVVYQQAPQQDHFWQDMFIYHAIFGGPTHTHTTVYQPAPVYHQPQVVNKTVQNITINQTVNHAPSPAPVAAAKPSAPNYAPQASVAAQPVLQKGGWYSQPAQVVKASTNYPKASNSNAGGYSMKSTGYSGYSQRSSGYSGSSYRSSGRK